MSPEFEQQIDEFERHVAYLSSPEGRSDLTLKTLKAIQFIVRTAADALTHASADVRRIDAIEAHPQNAQIQGGALDGQSPKCWVISCDPKYTLREAIDLIYPA